MFELGEAVRVHMDLHAAVGPVLGELRAQTGESSQVGVLDGHEVVYVDRLESAHSLRLFTETGRRVPVHCTSSGKVLLAYLPEARRQAVLRAAPFTALTPHTITDRSQLAAELDRVRRRGWAEAVNEREIGVASIAAPVRDVSGEVIAAISIGVPLARCSVMALRRLAPVIMEAAEAASRRLGWSGESHVRCSSERKGEPEMPLTDAPGKARALYEARQSRRQIEPFTDADPDLGMADGYAVQQELVKLLLADGDRIVGYKVGLTSKPMQKMIGVDTPDYGPVLGSTVYADGDAVPVSAFIQPKIEAEIAFVLGSPLAGPGVSVLDARRAIAGMTAAVEIVDSRFADWRIKLADTVADLASNGAVAISSRVVPAGGHRPAADRDGAHPAGRPGRHRRRRGRARRPGPGGGLAGQHARRDGRQAGGRAPGHDRGAARRRADAGRGRVPRRIRPSRPAHRPRRGITGGCHDRYRRDRRPADQGPGRPYGDRLAVRVDSAASTWPRPTRCSGCCGARPGRWLAGSSA